MCARAREREMHKRKNNSKRESLRSREREIRRDEITTSRSAARGQSEECNAIVGSLKVKIVQIVIPA